MKQTIYFLSDLKWYNSITSDRYSSKSDVLRAHLNYIEKSKDFVFALSDKKHIIEKSKQADKRVNSRIAVSFALAIPNDISDVRRFAEKVRDELAELNDMNKEDIYIAFHDAIGVSGRLNKHFHIVLPNINKKGRSIRIGRDRSGVRELHRRMQRLIESEGYIIKRDKEEDKLEHIGTALRYNSELKQAYIEYLQAKEEIRRIEQEKEKRMISLDFAKQHINLVEFAVRKFGYRIKKDKSSRHYKTLEKDGDVIVIKRNAKNNHWIYFSAVSDEDNGTIIDFIQNRTGYDLGAVRRFLQEYLKEKREDEVKELTDFEVEVSSITEQQNAVLREYTRLKSLSRSNYLKRDRKIDIDLSRYDIWEDDRGNVVFGLYGEAGELIGLAKYNRNFKQIVGQKGIWTSYTGDKADVMKIRQIVITESPIDALSYKELNNDDDEMFLIATMGQIGDRTIGIIKNYIRAVMKLADVESIVIALDNDDTGRRMTEKLQTELTKEFDNVIQDIPLEKDWNEELKKEKRRYGYGPGPRIGL